MQLRHSEQKQRVCSDQSTYLFTQAMLLSHATHQTKLYIKVSEHLLSSKHGRLSCKVTYMLFHSGMQYVVLEHSGRRLQTCWMMECFCAGGKHRLAITLWPSGLLCFLFRSLCWSCDITTFLTCNLFLLLYIYIFITMYFILAPFLMSSLWFTGSASGTRNGRADVCVLGEDHEACKLQAFFRRQHVGYY